jgi:peptidoglycan/xylan/chitin deacetylase (PgdA/CDA1 family)
MTPTVIDSLKTFLGYALYATPWPRFYFRDKFIVTAFHRINSTTLGDGITCAPDMFRRVCVWLKQNFRVIPLADQIDALESKRILGGTASITFDDGYLDNFEIAAPILRELGLPATFFVATDFLGSTTVPTWESHGSPGAQWMTWDHIDALAQDGFDIESHTCTHANLCAADAETVRRELRDSLLRLTQALGSQRRLFAYPFGGREHINNPVREMVRQVGYRCCLSCYGGINSAAADPYSLRRVPVNEEYHSVYQLGLELLRASVGGAARDLAGAEHVVRH